MTVLLTIKYKIRDLLRGVRRNEHRAPGLFSGRYFSGHGVVFGDTRARRRVNISGSGIAFTTTRKADKGTEVEISLILPTTNTPVKVLANVVACKRIPTENEEDVDQFRLRAHYQSEQDALTEQIVHFVSKKQQEILAERRHLTHPDLL